ncbi:MAG: glycosyltransferase [Lachnospiraceae bacterium]|nr:glycosyltransferase [Lachnospiraceae bacterium]
MQVLYLSWGENSFQDAYDNLIALGYEVQVISSTVKDYLAGKKDGEITSWIASVTEENALIFSFNFLPGVSRLANEAKIRYVSLVYDWPNYTLYDPAVYGAYNEIHLFDRGGVLRLQEFLVSTVFHHPLCVDVERIDEGLKKAGISFGEELYDVSFVGNLYPTMEEALGLTEVPTYYRGFFQGMADAQGKLYGINLAHEILDATFAQKYYEAVGMSLGDLTIPKEDLLSKQVNDYITGKERVELIAALGEHYSSHLFTGNVEKAKRRMGEVEHLTIHGPVDYYQEMPQIFRTSKVNLNLTARSITSGIPLRVLDILGAGGFCVSNYQEEILEYFEDGKDLVLFSSKEELLEKVDYYLNHDEKRRQIAQNGHSSVAKLNYRDTFKELMERK